MLHRALLAATAGLAAGAPLTAGRPGAVPVVLVDAPVRDSMNAVFARSTREWRRYPNNVNPINYGAGSPGWQEALRCLRGTARRDTVWVRGWAAARGTRALASAVTGDCSGVAGVVGTWHTHPWRADSTGRPVKVPGLSAGDLRTFRAGSDAVALVQWDGDSLAAAARGADGAARYPAPVTLAAVPAP
jgi:hypothetical protein